MSNGANSQCLLFWFVHPIAAHFSFLIFESNYSLANCREDFLFLFRVTNFDWQILQLHQRRGATIGHEALHIDENLYLENLVTVYLFFVFLFGFYFYFFLQLLLVLGLEISARSCLTCTSIGVCGVGECVERMNPTLVGKRTLSTSAWKYGEGERMRRRGGGNSDGVGGEDECSSHRNKAQAQQSEQC